MTQQQVEELLKPRYKVIADYPNSPYKVGDLYVFKKKLRNSFYEKVGGFSTLNLYAPEKYPHLFRKLEWWEEREEKDMPLYVKDDTDVYKVQEWDGTGTPYVYINDVQREKFVWGKGHDITPVYGVLPSTLDEYNQYLSKQ